MTSKFSFLAIKFLGTIKFIYSKQKFFLFTKNNFCRNTFRQLHARIAVTFHVLNPVTKKVVPHNLLLFLEQVVLILSLTRFKNSINNGENCAVFLNESERFSPPAAGRKSSREKILKMRR